jgi:hypothetical protein
VSNECVEKSTGQAALEPGCGNLRHKDCRRCTRFTQLVVKKEKKMGNATQTQKKNKKDLQPQRRTSSKGESDESERYKNNNKLGIINGLRNVVPQET